MKTSTLHIIINSTKRTNSKIDALLNKIIDQGEMKVLCHTTVARADAQRYAREKVKDQDLVIAVGGDGTCNEIITGLMEANRIDVALGIIPAGTGNDFLRMCVPNSENSLPELIKMQRFQNIDLGKVEVNGASYYFLNIADLGLGGKVIEIMERQRAAKIGGKFSYASSIIRGFFTYKKPTVKIRSGDFNYEGKLMLLGFCNGGVFGHGLTIFPNAKVDDGELGFTIIGDVTLFDYVKYLSKLKKGKHIDHPQVHYVSGKSITLEIKEGVLFGETDGELIPAGNCQVSVLPRQIRLINTLR